MTRDIVTNPHILKKVIQDIYQCIPNPENISEVIKEIGDLLQAPYTSFQVENRFTHEMKTSIMTGYGESALKKYGEYFVYHDPWTQQVIKRGLIDEGFTLCQDLVSDKQFCNTEFYQDWGRYEKVRHAVGTNFTLDDAYILKIALQRHDEQNAFSSEEARFLNLLRPHIKQFVRLSNLNAREYANRQGWIEGLDRLKRGVWVVDANMKVVHLNTMAESIVAGHKDNDSKGWIDIQSGRLSLSEKASQEELLRRVASLIELISPVSPGVSIDTHALTDSLYEYVDVNIPAGCERLWLAPLALQGMPGLVAIISREDPTSSEEIQKIFDLPERQAQLCALLAQGETLQSCSESLNISLNTTRNTLAACYRRLNVNNQSKLILKVHSQLRL